MGKYKSQWTGPQIDEGVGAARNPDTTPTADSDALITSDAVAKVQQGFAPIENDATASQAYAIGDLLVWGGILYKAKTVIAVNDSFTVGTNIEATTIADKLNNIDTEITSNTDTTLTGVLIGNGSKVGTKSLDTSSLTNDADHVPVSSVVKSALTSLESDLASIHATGPTNTTGAAIAAGTYFYLAPQSGDDEIMVQAKADIAINATFTLNTNYKTVTAGGLNDLMSAFGKVLYTSNTPFTSGDVSIPGISNYKLALFIMSNDNPLLCSVDNSNGFIAGGMVVLNYNSNALLSVGCNYAYNSSIEQLSINSLRRGFGDGSNSNYSGYNVGLVRVIGIV